MLDLALASVHVLTWKLVETAAPVRSFMLH
jgi:hypothetical protein